MKAWFAIGLALASVFILTACNSADRSAVNPVPVQSPTGLVASVLITYENDEGEFVFVNDPNVARMFDGKVNTFWPSAPRGCKKAGISLFLVKPSYLKRIRLIHNGRTFPTTANVTVYQDSTGDSYYKSGRDFHMERVKNQYYDFGADSYPSVLKAGAVTIFLMNCAGGGEGLEISEIELEVSDRPVMRPLLSSDYVKSTIKSIAKYHANNQVAWHFPDDENRAETDKLLSHLMYYGLLGDKEADSIFKNYFPTRTDIGEEVSALQSWYEESKSAK